MSWRKMDAEFGYGGWRKGMDRYGYESIRYDDGGEDDGFGDFGDGKYYDDNTKEARWCNNEYPYDRDPKNNIRCRVKGYTDPWSDVGRLMRGLPQVRGIGKALETVTDAGRGLASNIPVVGSIIAPMVAKGPGADYSAQLAEIAARRASMGSQVVGPPTRAEAQAAGIIPGPSFYEKNKMYLGLGAVALAALIFIGKRK